METKPASSRMFSLLVLYDMQTKYFDSVLDGVSDNDALKRLDTKANHIAWLTGSMVQERFEIANMHGHNLKPAGHELFTNNKGIQDDVTYPTLDTYKNNWQTITPILREVLMNISDQKLDETFEMMPGWKLSHFELITFLIYREANIIGQLALWRRFLNYDAMKYM